MRQIPATMHLLVFATLIAVLSSALGQEYTHGTNVTFIRGDFQLKWRVVNSEIEFRARAPTSGWLGLGFNTRHELNGGDLFVFWYDDTAKRAHSYDCVIERYVPNLGLSVRKDLKEDYTLVGNPVAEGQSTEVTFKRPLSTCDFEHDVEIGKSTINLIFAFGTADPRPDLFSLSEAQLLPLNNPQTSGFFVKPALLLDKQFAALNGDLNGATTLKLTIDNSQLTMSQSGTFDDILLYNCKAFQLLTDTKARITGYAPVIPPAMELKQIRAAVYACPRGLNPNAGGAPFDCRPNAAHSTILNECTEMIASVSPGGDATQFPDGVGISLDNAEYGGRHVVLQVVIDKSLNRRGKTGVEFHMREVVPTRRPGGFSVVADPSYRLVVPPRVPETQVRTICDTRCMEDIPTSGLEIFAVSHHTRSQGRSVTTRLLRNGEERALISHDANHNWMFEPFFTLDTPVRVLPGDQILVECSFNTTELLPPRWTFGGFSSSDETCGAIFHYTPRVANFTSCGSAVEPRQVFPLFSIFDYENQFQLGANKSQFDVTTEAFRRLARLDNPSPDRCTIERVNSLSLFKDHLPVCNGERSTRLKVKMADIKTKPPVGDGSCPNAPVLLRENYTWPSGCFQIVYQDELPQPAECPSSGAPCQRKAVAFLFFSFALVIVASKEAFL